MKSGTIFNLIWGSHQNLRDFQTHVKQNHQKWRNFQAHLCKIVQYASFMQNSDFMHFLPKRQKYAKTYAICNCIDLLCFLSIVKINFQNVTILRNLKR